jgi:hypothetical protein
MAMNSHQQAIQSSLRKAAGAKHIKGASNRAKVKKMPLPEGFKGN